MWHVLMFRSLLFRWIATDLAPFDAVLQVKDH